MDLREALEKIREDCLKTTFCDLCPYKDILCSKKLGEPIIMSDIDVDRAVEAVENGVKKLKWRVSGSLVKFAECPACGFSYDIDDIRYHINCPTLHYCPACGKRLYWEAEIRRKRK